MSRTLLRDRFDHLRRLTLRDRQLLAWLAEHYVLSTGQITQALFPSARSARLRLATLYSIEAVSRFVDVTTGDRQNLYTLGPLGMLVHPTTFHDPDHPDARAPRTSFDRVARIVGSRNLRHLLGTNQMFVDLISHTRSHPGGQLRRWWSEQHATAAFAIAGIRPDGHGIWSAGGRTVGFFLEHDNATEPLGTVLAKLRAYSRLAEFGPRYPVLLRVPSRRREAHLVDALTGVATAMPVAVGVHDEHPAGAAWTLTADPGVRRCLHELPSDHGPANPATNPHRYLDDSDD
ncbi:replication-relaxation family protein [Micromonospora sp. R77]|uniref:replication-relaxation family protein n=1 Tax=Micromonospora sp. R77 TaxID=2925836 RepID=UPI001F6232FD|nr:replication-relaxation family protein [Micromonospora sp. R77]MCI4066190.1 replication-relaxation family protein [Micromonospora sp. R77]